MAGIYIHIPFCRQACHYCDFHFSTNLSLQNELVDALTKEVVQRKGYLTDPVNTIYFGGGTPSLLTKDQMAKLLNVIYDNYQVDGAAEITLEANPEDLTLEKAKEFFQLGINRLSIGIQTFHADKLNWMNRAHTVTQTQDAYFNVRSAGFNNVSLDLIYALPDSPKDLWEYDLNSVVKMGPEHISLYGLTIEDRTVFGNWEKKGMLEQLEEDMAANQYLFAIDFLTKSGYTQYEVSNFGKKGFHSRHNHAYWAGTHYLGIGPGAHSFNGKSRQINVRNNPKYVRAINGNSAYFETELLNKNQLLNERILTSLRTSSGISISELMGRFNVDLGKEYEGLLNDLKRRELIKPDNGYVRLTPKGFLIADEIALRMFFPE